MKKELSLSLRKLNFIVLKKIANKRGYKVGGSRTSVELGEMENLLNTIQSKKSLTKTILIYTLAFLMFGVIMTLLLNYHLNFINFKFDFITSNLVIFIGIISNFYLIFIYQKTQLSDRSALIFLVIDILQLAILLYLSGGIINPFVIFIIIPSVFSSSNLSFRTNTLLVLLTAFSITFLTFYSTELPSPLGDHFHVSPYYYYSIPIALIVALVFLNYFAMTFGTQSRLRKEALTKMEEVMAKEHELLSLGGQAAAAAHSLGTPLSTIKIITQELLKQFEGKKDVEKDINLLSSQVYFLK